MKKSKDDKIRGWGLIEVKIRWSEGSVRFRITPDELETLKNGGTFRETLELPKVGATWSAAVSAAGSAESILTYDGASVWLHLSAADIARLADENQEGVYFKDGDELRYYLEKDFPCVHPRPAEAEERETGTFVRQ